MSNETDVLQAIRLHLSTNNEIIMWRNPSGALYDKDGRLIRYGLGHTSSKSIGSSDLIGARSIIITPAMVGRRIAIFCAIEVKNPGAHTKPDLLERQTNFLRVVREAGGIAGFASSVAEAESIINASPGHQPEPA